MRLLTLLQLFHFNGFCSKVTDNAAWEQPGKMKSAAEMEALLKSIAQEWSSVIHFIAGRPERYEKLENWLWLAVQLER